MSGWEIAAAILILFFIGYPIIWFLGLVKELVDEVSEKMGKRMTKNRTSGSPSFQSQSVSESQKTDNEIINDPAFQRTLEYLRPCYRWMTLAGGTDPWLHPLIYFEQDGSIILKKHGYDLYDKNIKEYYSSSEWAKREKALEQFGQDLFGRYAEEMKQIISLDYIADHLIELEQATCSSSDFYLTYSTHGSIKTQREKELFRRELQNTPIIKMKQE